MVKLLLKAVAVVRVAFQNPPLSPGRAHARWFKQRGGSTVSMIPVEARRKQTDGGGSNIDYQEPTSPKVSCMGQIKHKKKQIKKGRAKSVLLPKDIREIGEDSSAFQRMFHGAMGEATPPPALGAMKHLPVGGIL